MPEEGTVHFLLHSLLEVLNLSNCPGLEKGGYLETMLIHTPLLYHGALLVSFGAIFLAWLYTSREKKIQERNISNESKQDSCTKKEVTSGEKADSGNTRSQVNSFEISPTDECEFVPLVSHEEDRRTAAELAPKTKYIPLDPNNPSAQVNAYLNKLRGDENTTEEESGDSDDNSEDELLEKASNFGSVDLSQYISQKDLHVLDDPRESPSRRGNLISRVKKAKQRAIQNAVEKEMTADDHFKEQMAANQMLSRVFTMMRENKQLFGDKTSFDDVKSQMDLYKA